VESMRIGRCLTGEELALLVRDGDVAGGQAAAHLASCARCREDLEHLRKVVSLAQPSPAIDPGDGFNRAVWERIERRRVHQRARIAVVTTLSAAAIALVVLLPRGTHVTDEADLVENLDLYQYMDLIENLDVVESVDTLLREDTPEG